VVNTTSIVMGINPISQSYLQVSDTDGKFFTILT
jgi:hypothetical protein